MTETGGDGRRRIGVFGGTFDPPHVGHVSVAADVADALDLDEVWWVPAARSPFKTAVEPTPAGIRLEMVRAATADDARFVVREDEIRRGGVSYTVDTLRAFRAEEPDAEFFLIVGADQAERMGEWRDVEEIGRLATLVAVARDGLDPAGIDSDRGRTERVSVRRVDASSSEIRREVAAGRDVGAQLPPAVHRVVRRAGLYRHSSADSGND